MNSINGLIAAKNISVIKAEKAILENIDIQINKNDFVTIIGPNGAGKTMLLKCLMGFYKPDVGEIIKKQNVKIGYMPQNINVINTMPLDVKTFITLRKKYDNISFKQVILETDIEQLINKQLSVLSGGELQRVLLARSLLNNPDLLILDEPAQNLDISGQMNFYKLLQSIYSKTQCYFSSQRFGSIALLPGIRGSMIIHMSLPSSNQVFTRSSQKNQYGWCKALLHSTWL